MRKSRNEVNSYAVVNVQIPRYSLSIATAVIFGGVSSSLARLEAFSRNTAARGERIRLARIPRGRERAEYKDDPSILAERWIYGGEFLAM